MNLTRELINQTLKYHRVNTVCRQVFQGQVRCGSYKNSKPVGDPSEYTDYEIVKNPEEWKYVERLLPKKWIPIPTQKESYPSGWVPPKADPEKASYFVERSRNHMLPIYLVISERGMKRETKIMRIEGDIWRLSEEIVEHLLPLTGHKTIGCKVEEIKRKITLRGDFVEYTKAFLLDKGF
ncbi:probable 39S ribosomal protein L49, mitochondrial [Macrosteles quadrilineatus]|uniref:probable 39S ribosomal protein L49, mitochondrial n=1 Tax=Macrosteles quadrilineatus TaxID=74068 RepID=UPI0023E0C947|nr:probable 39S ribosomal protein L49, mitochondrial [Macrosteles quadrilineatus]